MARGAPDIAMADFPVDAVIKENVDAQVPLAHGRHPSSVLWCVWRPYFTFDPLPRGALSLATSGPRL